MSMRAITAWRRAHYKTGRVDFPLRSATGQCHWLSAQSAIIRGQPCRSRIRLPEALAKVVPPALGKRGKSCIRREVAVSHWIESNGDLFASRMPSAVCSRLKAASRSSDGPIGLLLDLDVGIADEFAEAVEVELVQGGELFRGQVSRLAAEAYQAHFNVGQFQDFHGLGIEPCHRFLGCAGS